MVKEEEVAEFKEEISQEKLKEKKLNLLGRFCAE